MIRRMEENALVYLHPQYHKYHTLLTPIRQHCSLNYRHHELGATWSVSLCVYLYYIRLKNAFQERGWATRRANM